MIWEDSQYLLLRGLLATNIKQVFKFLYGTVNAIHLGQIMDITHLAQNWIGLIWPKCGSNSFGPKISHKFKYSTRF